MDFLSLDYFSVVGIAIGLAMDAFAVSVANGALTRKLNITYTLKLAFFFGGFQFLMPIIGCTLGKVGEAVISGVDHWVAFILLAIIGGKMIADYKTEIKDDETPQKRDCLQNRTILILAVATSIDALATGIILPSAVGASNFILILVATGMIGLITFIISVSGVYFGKIFGYFFAKHSELFGGTILILIGVKILFEHLISHHI